MEALFWAVMGFLFGIMFTVGIGAAAIDFYKREIR